MTALSVEATYHVSGRLGRSYLHRILDSHLPVNKSITYFLVTSTESLPSPLPLTIDPITTSTNKYSAHLPRRLRPSTAIEMTSPRHELHPTN